jgi:hypothetical protein
MILLSSLRHFHVIFTDVLIIVYISKIFFYTPGTFYHNMRIFEMEKNNHVF